MLGVARLGDTYSDTDVQAEGSGTVFANGIPVARLGDFTTGHGPKNFPPVPIVQGSGSVFADGIPIARLGDAHSSHTNSDGVTDSGVFITASGDVFAG